MSKHHEWILDPTPAEKARLDAEAAKAAKAAKKAEAEKRREEAKQAELAAIRANRLKVVNGRKLVEGEQRHRKVTKQPVPVYLPQPPQVDAEGMKYAPQDEHLTFTPFANLTLNGTK